jgi:hypothetical protein
LTVALILENLGIVALHQRENELALVRLQESLKRRRIAGDQIGVASCLENFAALFANLQRIEQAAQLYGTAAMLRETLGVPVSPLHRRRYDQDVIAVRDLLGASGFDKAELVGRKTPLEQVLASLGV